MCGNLSNFHKTDDFLRLSPAQLQFLLECDFPVDCTEAQVSIVINQFHFMINLGKQPYLNLFGNTETHQVKSLNSTTGVLGVTLCNEVGGV